MPKKVFDPNIWKIAVIRIDIQNHALQVRFAIKNLILGNFPNAKEGFWP